MRTSVILSLATLILIAAISSSTGAQSPATTAPAPQPAVSAPYRDTLAGEKNFVPGVQPAFDFPPLANPAPKVPEGFTPIFNGTSLAGWHPSRTNIHGTAPNFFVLNGAIVGAQSTFGEGGILLTDKSYKNFELYMEVRPDYGCDSGVFIRSNEAGDAYQITMDYLPGGNVGSLILESYSALGRDGVKAQVAARATGQGAAGRAGGAAGAGAGTGGAGGRGGAPVVAGIPLGSTTANGEAPWMKVWKREAWNSVRIRVEGDIPHVQVWINDALVTDAQETTNRVQVTSGPVAIQMHMGNRWVQAGFWRWRNIGIKELR